VATPEVTVTAAGNAEAPVSRWRRIRRFLPFLGPAFLVSVGYMDPGNWATNIAAGSSYGYTLLWVLLMSNIMALLLQALSAKLGVATGTTLARAIRDNTSRPMSLFLWITAEFAAMATDLAEFLGAALGLYILLKMPLFLAALVTGVLVFLILALHRFGHRAVEIVIISLVAIVGVSYVYEVFVSQPAWADVGRGVIIPGFASSGAILVAVGMLGATVMPHNVFLGSHVVQARRAAHDSPAGKRKLYKFALIDLGIALNIAFFINAAMVIMAAAAFGGRGVAELQDAHVTLGLLFGGASAIAFAVALISAGLSSSVTGTLAGQSIMEGFIGFRMWLWARRAITMVPALIAIWFAGDQALLILIWSQVVLSLQLPFTIIPLIWLTSKRSVMGEFVNKPWVTGIAVLVAAIILAFNAYLIWSLLV
jgi:manganese transport protein